MTPEERQMQRADRFAAAWWASDLQRQEAARAAQQAAADRADAYAAECARWLALQGVQRRRDLAEDLEAAFDRGVAAILAEQGGAIGLPPAPVASQPEIGAPAPAQAAPVASGATHRQRYARDSGDPGAVAGYRPPWAAETVRGRRP